MLYLGINKTGREGAQTPVPALTKQPAKEVLMAKSKISNSVKEQKRYIYKITDTSTGEFYIGCRTCCCPIGEDGYMGSSKYWERNEPQEDTLVKEIIECGFESEEAKFSRESELIAENFDDPKNINIHNPSKNFWGDTYYSGEENGMYGVRGEDHHGATPIYQFTKSGEFVKEWKYVIAPEEQLGYNHSLVSRCLSGNALTAYGYVWRYKHKTDSVEDEGGRIKTFFNNYEHGSKGREYSEDTLRKMSEAKKGKYVGKNNPNYGRSHDIETRKKISKANSGENNHFYGKKRPKHSKRMTGRMPNKRKVLHISTGNIYKSLGEASRETGLSRGTICKHCKGGYAKQKFKYHGKPRYVKDYSDEEKEGLVKPMKKWIKDNGHPCLKKCMIIETGEVFDSAKALAEYEGISQSTVSMHCSGKRKNQRYKFVND